MRNRLAGLPAKYKPFRATFVNTLNEVEPVKFKYERANHKPWVNKKMRKGMMLRSQLQNLYFKHGTEEYRRAWNHQKNYCNRLAVREKKRYCENLNLNDLTDNKKFYRTMKPLMGDKGGIRDNIVLVDGERVISDDLEVAQEFNDFFDTQVDSLGICENKMLMNEIEHSEGRVLDAIKMYESHPSILKIKENVEIGTPFSFKTIAIQDMEAEIKAIDSGKAYPLMDIPPKRLKDVMEVVSEPLMNIWNKEVVGSSMFASRLKWADMAPRNCL